MLKRKKELEACLKTLCLSGMRFYYEELARTAEEQTLRYEEYLLELALRECEIRYNKRIARLLRESKLPLEKTSIPSNSKDCLINFSIRSKLSRVDPS